MNHRSDNDPLDDFVLMDGVTVHLPGGTIDRHAWRAHRYRPGAKGREEPMTNVRNATRGPAEVEYRYLLCAAVVGT